MPLYEYQCENCEFVVEKIEFGDEIDRLHICPKCSLIMKRNFTPTSTFRLKYDTKKDKVSWGAEGYSSTQRYRKLETNDE